MPTDRSRDLRIAAATALLGGGGAAVLLLGAHWARPLISYARPELVLAFLLALAGAAVLAWNALWAIAALLSQMHALPVQARRALLRAAGICGTGRARRIISRSLASSAIGASALGLGMGAAIAQPREDPAPADPASLTWIWEASDSAEARAPGTGAAGDSEMSAGPQSGSAPGARPDPAPAPPPLRTDTPPAASGSARPADPDPADQRPTDERRLTDGRGALPSEEGSPAASPTRTVLPGDTLWEIARAQLPPGADAATIDETWRTIYALNADAIGSDPNLIRPGQTLLLPQESK
ncbi:MAG: LysM peptidoglycan-binding domain-containing protein [Schaalia hyovaginalis]|uniref:LysM peptidoglycan-binding domain-containing protein n=1 Tax=Schaalia hyovaginalis TaxID=29316 RepID=UPI002A90D44D|nr:LysM peptidoglycan-binding domain-containing protein [Schaalia hyovaginalis]MDY5600991.1 LysM peptidoglycan-binding domain-containing protein [Schaalia hyovaginalis]